MHLHRIFVILFFAFAAGGCEEKAPDPTSPPQPVLIDKDFTTATVLEDRIENPEFPDYIVTKDVAVKSQLTLHPGVVIAFARDTRFTVADEGGVLISKGTVDRKVRLIGQQTLKGFWSGVMINSASSGNVLEYTEIMHAGSQTMLDNTKMAVAMFIESQVTFKNCIFSNNDGYGLFVQEGAVIREFAANAFTSNTQAGIRLPSDQVALLDQASVFDGDNGRNIVEVIGAFLGNPNVKEEVVWKGFNDQTPYRLMNTIAVRTGWKLSPGVTIEVAGDGAIIINEEGYLHAKGTENSKIKFTGSAITTAHWSGILVHSQNQQNLIQYAEISNGGSVPLVSSENANLALYGDNARMTIKNTRISGSGGYGIWIGYGSILNADHLESNVFENNRLGAVFGQFVKNGRQASLKYKGR
ncbi:MAG: right-handed parallel beta-helix repeat-containing protein [Dyadobacter fermentans]